MLSRETFQNLPKRELVGVAGFIAALGIGLIPLDCQDSSDNQNSFPLPEVVCRRNPDGYTELCSDKLECRELFRELQSGKHVTINDFQETCYKDNTFTRIIGQ